MGRMKITPGWDNEPAPSAQRYACPLLRVRKDKPLSVVFLAPMAIGRYLHWNGERTVPCVEEGCELCVAGRRRDWKMYSPVWSPRSDSLGMLELPYSALKYFQQQYARTLTCYGMQAEVVRLGDGEKGKVCIMWRGKWEGKGTLPEGPDAIQYMQKVWGVWSPDPTPATKTAPKSSSSKLENTGNNGVLPLK